MVTWIDKFSGDKKHRFASALEAARAGESEVLGGLLEDHRNYLNTLAETQMSSRLQRRVSPADIVQEVMLSAHRDLHDFKGSSQNEFAAWLRAIAVNCIRRAVDRHIHAQKRDVRREVQQARWNNSGGSLASIMQLLASPDSTPSADLRKQENVEQIGEILGTLKDEYRQVITLRIFHGLAFDQIAKQMDRSEGATRMLWMRALSSFKDVFEAR